MKSNLKLFVLLMFLSFQSISQSHIAIGEWKAYLPFQRADNMTQSEDKVYLNTGQALFSIDKNDESNVEFMTKVDGLSGSSIKFIRYDNFNQQLLVIYDNSTFDIIKDGRVTPILGIAQSNGIPGDKSIYSIHIADEHYAYIGTGFGLVQFNLETYDFGFTTEMLIRVNDIDHIGSEIFVATVDGIYTFDDAGSNGNPGDFNQWVLQDEKNSLPSAYESRLLAVFDQHLYMEMDDNIWKRGDDGEFTLFLDNSSWSQSLIQLYPGKNELLVGSRAASFKSRVQVIEKNGNIIEVDQSCSNLMTDLMIEDSGKIWFCDEWGKIRFMNDKNGNCNYRSYNSPYVSHATDINIVKDVVYVANGGVGEKYQYLGTRDGYSRLKDREWFNFVGNDFPQLNQNDFANLFRVLKHPKENKIYLGSYWNGLMIHNYDDNSIIHYNKDNSSLGGTIDDEERTRISGFQFDDQGNLWVSNYGASSAVSVLTPEGTWRSFNVGSNRLVTRIVIDDYGNKWFSMFNGGVLVLQTDSEDVINGEYKYKKFSSSNSALESNQVNDIIKDHDGSIWVGTSKGPVIFNCGDVFNSECSGNRQKVVEDGDVAFLLETENILSMEIDGANRKWFGTSNGIFVQSASGDDKVLFLNAENSPLFHNTIKDLAFNPKSGEMFILNTQGLQSYRTQTTKGKNTHSSNVIAFPNPVRPEYTGDIAISGLAQNAFVKITDVTGKLVYETQALGGQAIWNGNDYNGNRASTGVYLVFSTGGTSFDTPDSFVTKIFIVK